LGVVGRSYSHPGHPLRIPLDDAGGRGVRGSAGVGVRPSPVATVPCPPLASAQHSGRGATARSGVDQLLVARLCTENPPVHPIYSGLKSQSMDETRKTYPTTRNPIPGTASGPDLERDEKSTVELAPRAKQAEKD